MAGQIDTNKYVTAIKKKQAEVDTAAAAGTAKLSDASAKVTELKAELSALIPTLPVIPSIQGELSKLGSLDAGGLLAKVGSLITTFAAAVPGLSDLMGSLGLSSFPPSIDISAITSKIPNVEIIDGKAVTQPAESKVAESAPPPPIVKEAVDVDTDELSLSLLKQANGYASGKIKANSRASWPSKKADRFAIKYIWMHARWVNIAGVLGITIEELAKIKNTGTTETYNKHIAEYTGAAGYDVNLFYDTVEARYNVIKDKHPERLDILDWAAVLKKYWEDAQKNK
jgi:hypothetical protein